MYTWSSSLAVLSIAISSVACGACGRAQPAPRTQIQTVVIPESLVRPTDAPTTLAPVARGTITLGTVETGTALPAPPNATGGGPPAAGTPGTPTGTTQTSVGPMSPTTVTGADSPLDSATTAPPAGGGPGNPTVTGSANTGGGPANAPTR